MNTLHTSTFPLPPLAAAVLDSVASEWDGCMCDAPGGEIDVGAALREAFPKRWASLVKPDAPALDAAAGRVRDYLARHALAVRLDQQVGCVINPGHPTEVSLRIDDLRTLLLAVGVD